MDERETATQRGSEKGRVDLFILWVSTCIGSGTA